MKINAKRLFSLALCIAFSALFCLSSSAFSTNEYGLGLSVSCEETDGKAITDITLKNSNSFDVENISISVASAEGLILTSGESEKNIGTLKSGETYSADLAFEPLVEQVAASPVQPVTPAVEKETYTGKVIAAAIITIAVAAAAAVLIKKNKKAAALMLTAIILTSFAGMFSVHAIGVTEAENFELEASINVDGKEYPLTVKVGYTASTAKNSYFEFDTAPEKAETDGQTLTRSAADFSGTATANESVKNVTYEIRSEIDGYETPVTGEADLAGCEWNVESLTLKPGKNEITFTAELSNGETQTQTYELTYDRGSLYEYRPDEVKEENGTRYIENVINIYFEPETTDERIATVLSENELAQIGEINGIRMVQTRTKATDLEGLNRKIAEIEKYEDIVLVCIDEVVELSTNVVPDDPWNTENNPYYTETWDESMPGGYNWHIEAVQAPSAWKYDKYFNNVKIGVIDGAFKTDHEDYDNLIYFPNSYYKDGNQDMLDLAESDPTNYLMGALHGTHVSGIIGAAANNGIGITGLLWDVDIYASSYMTGGTNTITNVVDQVTAQVESGAKAVNLSIGLSNTTAPNPYLAPFSDSTLAQTAQPCAVGMSALLKTGYEFVIVQSAGNGVIDTRLGIETYRSADAYQNGIYCSILENGSYGTLTASQVKAVYDRIIVVGAVRNKSNQSVGIKMDMFERSNGGDRVDIYAPGVNVFSTIADHYNDDLLHKYATMTGTSQSAPIVTAIAGMCFAIKPDFTGAQVKAIICDEANTAYVAHDYSLKSSVADENGDLLDYHPFEGDGRVVNMKLCAEAALRATGRKASYTYLNRIVAAAQSLDPNAFTNYDTVQAVIDSIDYNLYEYEQDKVSAKANELIAAMDKLIEKDPADYSAVDEAVNRANALNPDHYVDFSAVTAAVNAVVYGKYADEQEAVNKMAQDINDAIAALELLCRIESSDPEVIADNNKFIIVIVQEKIADLLSYLSTGGYTATIEPNKYGKHSTGSIIRLTNANTISVDEGIEYTVVTVGDVNGDGVADAEDAMLVNLCINGDIEMPDEKLFPAYDANCDGSIAEDDVELLEQVGLYNDVIINFYEAEASA